jgi:dienelactone hydrolase
MGRGHAISRAVGLVLGAAIALLGCSPDDPTAQPLPSPTTTAAPSGTDTPSGERTGTPGAPTGSPAPSGPSDAGAPTPSAGAGLPAEAERPPPTRGPVRLERWFDRELSGGGLRIGRLREQTSEYRSYNVSYRSQDYRISGVLNVPRGRGPFPAVVLAHGYIDPAIYVRGQGMPRERRALAAAGYVALHVDYRNHAASDDDPALQRTVRLGYPVDVLNAVNALRATDEVPVDDERIALMGRSMGGGVVYKALEMAPGLTEAAVVWAAVSSDEADNYRQFARPSPFWNYVDDRWGPPDENPDFWKGISPDQHFNRITEPVLIVHGTADTTCPPRWASHTARAMERAGVPAVLKWYEGEGHTFGAAFDQAMARTVRFLDNRLG